MPRQLQKMWHGGENHASGTDPVNWSWSAYLFATAAHQGGRQHHPGWPRDGTWACAGLDWAWCTQTMHAVRWPVNI